MMQFRESLAIEDADVMRAIECEQQREQNQIELIASENIVSPAVLEAQGSILTNKYAEGYPAHRYYGGCGCVDMVENLAIERAKKLFNAAFVNVQPHSGSQANTAVYVALLKPMDTILGMALDAGGHLTHGAKVSFSGKWLQSVTYGVCRDTGLIDYNQVEQLALENKPKLIIAGGAHPNPLDFADVVTTTTHKTLRGPRGGMILTNNAEIAKKIDSAIFPGTQGGPLMHVIAAKAVCFGEALTPTFKDYAAQVVKNAKVLGETLRARGLNLVSGGTDTHLLLVDLRPKNLTGDVVEKALEAAHMTCNKNAIPFDPMPPKVTSGIRVGTPAGTTRGFKEAEFEQVGHWIGDVIDALATGNADKVIAETAQKVISLCQKFPIYK